MLPLHKPVLNPLANPVAVAALLCCFAAGVLPAQAQDAPPEPSGPSAEPQSPRGPQGRDNISEDGQDRQRVRSDRERDIRDNRDGRPNANRPQTTAVQRQEAINVRGRRDVDDRQVSTASKLVITKEEMEKFGDTNIADVLKRAPGVTVGGAAGRGGGEIRMRGLGRGYTQMLVNGEPAPPGFSLDTLSPDQLERIEIFRTATAQFSTQAVAGSINIVLKDGELPPEKALRLGFRTGTRAGVFAGTSLNDKIGKFTYNLGISLNKDRSRYEGLNTEEGTNAAGMPTFLRLNQVGNRGENMGGNINGRLRYAFSEADSVALDVFARASNYEGQSFEQGSTPLGPPPRFGAANTDVEANSSGNRLRLNWTHKFLGNSAISGGKLESRIGTNRNRRNSLGVFEGISQPSSPQQGQPSLNRQTDSGGTDNGTSAATKLTAPIGDGHQLVTGIDLERSQRSEFRIQNEQYPAVLGTNTTGLLPLVFANEVFEAQVQRTAAFVQDEWDVTRDWSLYLGLRTERIRTTSQGNTYAPIDTSAQVTSPILQSLWKLDANKGQVRLGLSRTFKAPGTSQLIPRRFTAVNNTSLTPDSMGNPLVKPELAQGIDLAYERFFRAAPQLPQGVFSISTYARRISGVIFNQTTLQADGRWVSMPTNVGDANVRGIEFEFKTALKNLWIEAPPIEVRTNAAFNRSTVSNIPGPNNRLAAQTPCSANVGFDHRWSTEFAYGASFSYSCGGPFRRSATQAGVQSDKRELDTYFLWRIKPGTNFRVSAVNLLARETVSQSSNVDVNGSFITKAEADTHRALRVGFETRFR